MQNIDFRNELISYLTNPKNRKLNPDWRSILSQDLKSLEVNNFSWSQLISYFYNNNKSKFIPYIEATIIPHIDSDDEVYDKLFDTIDIYQDINDLFLHSNYLECVPKSIKQFSNLKSLTLIGERLWNLCSDQIPKSLQELVIESRVLSRQFYKDLHLFDKVHLLGIYQIPQIELAYISKLKTLIIFEPDLLHLDTFLARYNMPQMYSRHSQLQKHILQFSVEQTHLNLDELEVCSLESDPGVDYI